MISILIKLAAKKSSLIGHYILENSSNSTPLLSNEDFFIAICLFVEVGWGCWKFAYNRRINGKDQSSAAGEDSPAASRHSPPQKHHPIFRKRHFPQRTVSSPISAINTAEATLSSAAPVHPEDRGHPQNAAQRTSLPAGGSEAD